MSNAKNKSIFHMNIASLSKHKEELEAALSLLDFQFDIIGITETKILKDITPIISPSLNGYAPESTPTESTKGGALIYIKKPLVYDRRDDLEKLMYKPKELESVFVEIAGKKIKYMAVFIVTHVWTLMISMNILRISSKISIERRS